MPLRDEHLSEAAGNVRLDNFGRRQAALRIVWGFGPADAATFQIVEIFPVPLVKLLLELRQIRVAHIGREPPRRASRPFQDELGV